MPGSPGQTIILAPEVNFIKNKLIVWWQQPHGPLFGQTSLGMTEKGTDWNMPFGSPVGAIEGGQVVYAGLPPDSQVAGHTSLGYVVQIKNVDGTLIHYQHLNGLGPGIQTGSFVGNGQVIGYSGGCATGSSANNCITDQWSSGPHIEVRFSPTYNSSAGIWGQNWQDPLPYFIKLGASLKPGTTGTNTIGTAYGPTGQPSNPIVQGSCAPWDIGCIWGKIGPQLTSWGEHIAIFAMALLLVVLGISLLSEKGVMQIVQSKV